MFNLWSNELPDTIELCAVQLPGREGRINEPSVKSMPKLLPMLVDGLAEAFSGPYAIYGHSLGALIAFAFTRELRRRGKPLPLRLFVSGRRAPQCPPIQASHHLPDPDFLREVTRRYGRIPAVVLEDAEVLALFLRIIRADIEIMDTYRYTEEPPLPMPLSAYGGTRDRTLTEALLDEWKAQTSSTYCSRMFEGDHFFPDTARREVIKTILDDLGHRTD